MTYPDLCAAVYAHAAELLEDFGRSSSQGTDRGALVFFPDGYREAQDFAGVHYAFYPADRLARELFDGDLPAGMADLLVRSPGEEVGCAWWRPPGAGRHAVHVHRVARLPFQLTTIESVHEGCHRHRCRSGWPRMCYRRNPGRSQLQHRGTGERCRRDPPLPVNMVWFSTPELLEIGDVPFVIPTVRPTRVDTLNYYLRVARRFGLDIHTQERVTDIRRKDADGFLLHTARGTVIEGADVVIATGYCGKAGAPGCAGEDLPHVHYYYDEPFRYAGRHVVVVGGRNSAVETALDLFRSRCHVHPGPPWPVVRCRRQILDPTRLRDRIKAGQIKAGIFGATVRSIAPVR